MKRAKPLYTIAELCRMTGLSRGQIERLLKRNGIRVMQTGRGKRWVPLAEIAEKLDLFARSLKLAEFLNDGPPL
jgi:excisionase family DNA binding protein